VSWETVLDVLLATSVLGVAVATLFAPRRTSSVMLFLVLGLLLVLVWTRLGAPDVALAEAAIASGVTGALLVSALTRRSAAGSAETPRGGWRSAAAELAVAGTGGVLLGGVLVGAARDGLRPDRLGDLALDVDGVVDQPVTTVLLDLRALDTLLEVAVLAAAVLAALAVHREGESSIGIRSDTRPVLVSFVRLTTPVVLLLTGWFLVAGSSRPGGAFQAGAVLAGAALLLLLTGRKDLVPTGRWLRPAVVLGLAVFLAAAVLTRLVEGGWLDLPASWGVAVVLVVETALVVSIAAGLTVLVVLSRPRYVDATASTETLGGAAPSDPPRRQTEELT